MKRLAYTLLFSLLAPALALAQYWSGALADGTLVRVDPRTQRVEHFTPRGAAQLWDGAHRLQDGSVIIVKDGVILSGGGEQGAPPQAPAQTPPPRAEPAQPQPQSEPPATGRSAASDPACIHLVIKVCGFDGQCGGAEACSPARQLLALEEDELRQGLPSYTTKQCHDALNDQDFFKPCTLGQLGPTPCRKLVDAVCGQDNQCSDRKGCAAAWQLLDMEGQEIGATLRRPERQVDSSLRCQEAMNDQRFFARCEAVAKKPAARQ